LDACFTHLSNREVAMSYSRQISHLRLPERYSSTSCCLNSSVYLRGFRRCFCSVIKSVPSCIYYRLYDLKKSVQLIVTYPVNEYETVRERIKSVDIEWEKYDFLDNTGMSDTMAENFNDLSKVSSLILVFVMVSSVLILLFVFLFWMKNRVHEMGVLLSIGKGKGTIVLQVLMEGLLIGAVAFVLATFSAPFVSKQVADYLVGYQLQEELERNQAEEGMVAKSVTETESSVVGVSVNIGTEVVFFTAISTMGMIVVSVLGSGIYIASQKPKDILSKMS